MADLTYDMFQEVVKGLPVQDILSMCGTQVAWRRFCQQPNFWRDLIRRSFTGIIENATAEDYNFLQVLNTYRDDKKFQEEEQLFLDHLIQEAKNKGQPYTPEEITEMTTAMERRVDGNSRRSSISSW